MNAPGTDQVDLSGRVAIITGGAGAIGRQYALALSQAGAEIVVNDLGCAPDGRGSDPAKAAAVVEEIEAKGGRALADGHDVAQGEEAEALFEAAFDAYGRLDILINNAGILRDRTIANLGEEEWDAVVGAHLKGTFLCTQLAAAHWRGLAKSGEQVDARIVNTTSASGLYANPGQANYGAAKAAIACLSQIAAKELGRYGVTVNAVAPIAHSRLTEAVLSDEEKRLYDPAHVAPLVAWLCSSAGGAVTGQVFNVGGGHISVAECWHRGPGSEKDAIWTVDELDELVPSLLAEATPAPDPYGRTPARDE